MAPLLGEAGEEGEEAGTGDLTVIVSFTVCDAGLN